MTNYPRRVDNGPDLYDLTPDGVPDVPPEPGEVYAEGVAVRTPAKCRFDALQLEQIEMLAGLGLRDTDIAKVMRCSRAELQHHAGAQLTVGRATALAKVAQTAFQMATSGTCPAATFFWLKCRGRWRTPPPEDVDENGNPDAPRSLAIE